MNTGPDSKTAQFLQTVGCKTGHSAGGGSPTDKLKGPVARIIEGMLRDHPTLIMWGTAMLTFSAGASMGLGGLMGAGLVVWPLLKNMERVSEELIAEAKPKACSGSCGKHSAPPTQTPPAPGSKGP